MKILLTHAKTFLFAFFIFGLLLNITSPIISAQAFSTDTIQNQAQLVAQAEPPEATEPANETDVDCSYDRSGIGVGGGFQLPFWEIVCGITEGLFEGLKLIYSKVILPLLIINPLPLDGASADSEGEGTLYSIWNNFRVIANILFIGVFLLAIIGQSFSWFFTPYELKKIIPRLFIGIIAVQLSWFMVAFVIDVFNILGAGIHGLMLAPLGGADTNLTFDFQGVAGNAAAVGALLTGVLGVVIASTSVGAISGLMPVMFLLFMGVLAAFATLLLRQALIYLLVVASPIAFVAWILPNTSGLFRTWWSFFSKALMMYPLIIALITAGQFFAALINAQGDLEGGVTVTNGILSVIALFAPYLLIPATFRFAGGAVAAISGNMDNLTKKADRRIFGDERIQGTWRYKRKYNMQRRKGTRKLNAMNKMDRWGTDDTGAVVNQRRNNRGRRLIKTATKFGANPAEILAQQRTEQYKQLSDLTSNGRDAMIFQLLSGQCEHPVGGGELDPDACAQVERAYAPGGLFSDPGGVEAALYYSMTKAIPGNQFNNVREAFLNNPRLPASMDSFERDRMLNRATNENGIQRKNPDQKWRNPDGSMPDDSGTLSGFMFEQNERYSAARTSPFEKTTYDAHEHAYQKATNAWERGQAGGGFESLDNNDQELIRQTQQHYNQRIRATERGPEASNERVRELRRNYEHLSNYNIPPRPDKPATPPPGPPTAGPPPPSGPTGPAPPVAGPPRPGGTT